MTKIREGYKETEIGVIPEDWEVDILSNLSIKIGDGLHGTPKYCDDGGYYFINGNNLKNGLICITDDTKKVDTVEFEKNKVDLRESSILISLNGTIGSLAFYRGEPIILSKSAGYVTLKEDQVKDYIFQVLQTKYVKDFILKELTGTTIRNLSLKTLRNIPVAKGTLPEQQRIAEILSTADDHIEKLDNIIEDYQLLKKGMMKKLLTEGIGHTEFKETEIGRIPKEWEVKRLDECFEFYGGYTASRAQLTDEGRLYLHYGDIHLRIRSYIDTNEDSGWMPRYNVEKDKNGALLDTGDIVLADASEDYEGVGKSIVIIKGKEEIVAGLHTIVGKDINESFDLNYKRYFLGADYVRNQFRRLATGAKVYGISKGNIGQILVSIPCKEEQCVIGKTLARLERHIELLSNEKEELFLFKKSLMDKLLTGKVRVV